MTNLELEYDDNFSSLPAEFMNDEQTYDDIVELEVDQHEYKSFLMRLVNMKQEQVRDVLDKTCGQYGKTYDEADHDFSIVLGEECKKRIRAIHDIKDLMAKNRKWVALTAWLTTHLPNDRKRVEQIIAAYSSDDSPAEFFTVAEALALGATSTNTQLVNGLIQLGALYLLPAPAKCGKSILASILCNCIQLGLPFLNRSVLKGNVLYIQNEENVGKTTAKRVYNSGLQDVELQDYETYNNLINSSGIVICRNLDIALDQDLIIAKVKEYDLKLVLIDSLNASLERSGLNDKSLETAGYLYRLQRLTHLHDFTIIILHHTTKLDDSSSQQGLMNGISGRSDITRANDGVFRLTRGEDKETKAPFVQLNTIPRDGDPIMLQYRLLKGEANRIHLDVLNESVLNPENLELQNSILRLLFKKWTQWSDADTDSKSKKPYGYTLHELVSATGGTKEDVILRLNDMLSSEGIISYIDHSIKKNKYAIAEDGESWLNHFIEHEDKIEERKNQIIEEQKLKDELFNRTLDLIKEAILNNDLPSYNNLRNSISDDQGKLLASKLSHDEITKLCLLANPSKYSIGDTVMVIGEDITTIVEKVTYDRKECYHLYYLHNVEKRQFTQEKIRLYETNSTIDHSRNIPE